MKAGIHPEYRDVVFHDTSADKYFVVGSTVQTGETIEYEGKTYPYMTIDVSSESHPFYTGKQRVAENDGRIGRFNKRYNRGKS
ncbi:MAG: type B 50S ribosomal protein L31 [Pseudomonadota bacterium]